MTKPVLTLFLTENMSLKEWDRLGLLNREMAIYVKLMDVFSIQIFSYGNVGDLAYEKSYSDLKVLIIPYYKKNLTLKNRWHLFKAESSLRKSAILKTNQIKGADKAVYYSKKYDIPLVTRCGYLLSTFTERQTKDNSELKKVLFKEKEAFNQARFGITSSERDREYVIKNHRIPSQNMFTVPNYVDQEVFSKKESTFFDENRNQNEVLFIGRLSDQKNLFSLLEAFEESEFATKLTLIGQGENLKALEKKAETSTKIIEFLGSVPNNELPNYIKKANVYILPSFYEGLPKTLLEAMSCGIPCIGTNVEGIREVITHGKNGILCETDSISIAKALDLVLSDGKLAENLGNQANLTINETYSLDKVVEIEKSLYKKLLKP